MKKMFFTLLCITISFVTAHAQGGAQFKFKGGDTYDFKTVQEGPPVTHVFEFTNTGKEPITVQDVRTSCGCTAANSTKTPVLPGKKGKIEVTYTTQGHAGVFEKEVYITSNVTENGSPYILHIKGTVTSATTAKH